MARRTRPLDPATAIAALARSSLVTGTVNTVLALGLLLVGAVLVAQATGDLADPVEVHVEREGTHLERSGRRAVFPREVRHVSVRTEDGERHRVNSKDLQPGTTATVWRMRSDDELVADEPRVSGNRLLAGIGLVVLAVPFAAVAQGSLRRARTLRRADVESAPRLVLGMDAVRLEAAQASPTAATGVLEIPLRVTESAHPRVRVGSDRTVIVPAADCPVDLSRGIPPWWEARVLQNGLLSKVVAMRSSPQQPWWVVDLSPGSPAQPAWPATADR